MSFTDVLRTRRLIGIVRGTEADAALRTVLALVEEGIEVVDVSLNTPDAAGAIIRARSALGAEAALGAGTPVTAGDAQRTADAGASFVVTPALGPAVMAAAAGGLPVVGGALTPSEVVAALDSGVTAIKLFPAPLGGLAYLRELRDPFPDVPFVPVGGVDAAPAEAYLAVGAVAVGIGSPLVGDAASGGSRDALRERARRFRGVLCVTW